MQFFCLALVACGDFGKPVKYGYLANDTRYRDQCEEATNTTDKPVAAVFASYCGNGHKFRVRPSLMAGLDDERVDPIAYANAVVHCERCASKMGYSVTADMSYFAESVRIEALQAEAKNRGLPNEFTERLVENFTQTRDAMRAFIAKLGPRYRKAYINPIWEARRRWRADRRELSAVETKSLEQRQNVLDAMVDGSLKLSDVDALFRTRDEYLAACTTPTRGLFACWSGPVGYRLTHTGIQAAAKVGMKARAEAEMVVFKALPNRSSLPHELRFALDESLHRERLEYRAWSKAKHVGASEKSMSSRFGQGEPMNLGERSNGVGEGRGFDPTLFEIRLSANAGTVHTLNWTVSRIDRRGSAALVHFEAKLHKNEVPVNCVPTGRIARISSGGYVEYEEQCSYRPVIDKEQPKSVTLRWAEAAKLRHGEFIQIFVDAKTQAAALVKVYASEDDARNRKMPRQLLTFPIEGPRAAVDAEPDQSE